MVSQLKVATLDPHRPQNHTVSGLVQVFTCSQRSFFTNVMAQALQIAGQGTPVLVVQFLKGGIGQGCDRPVQLGQHLDWIRCDLPRCIDSGAIEPAEAAAIQDLWQYTQRVVQAGQYALVVLDELSMAINLGLVPEEEVLALLSDRPSQVDIILTGPSVSTSLLEVADQITEIRRSLCA